MEAMRFSFPWVLAYASEDDATTDLEAPETDADDDEDGITSPSRPGKDDEFEDDGIVESPLELPDEE